MKVMFLKDIFDSPACQVYRKGEVHDIPPEKYEIFKGRSDDHVKVLEDAAPKRGRPPKDEKPDKPQE